MTQSPDRAGPLNSAKSIAAAGLMASVALIFSYIEVLIPFNFGVPGVKLGIANLVIIVALYYLNGKYALVLNAVRIFIAGLLFSGVFGIIYSLAGGMLSLSVMAFTTVVLPEPEPPAIPITSILIVYKG